MDQRNGGHQTGGTGHDHIIWRFRVYGTAVRRIYAPVRMDVGLLRVYELFCRGEPVSVRVVLSVAAKKRRCPFFRSVIEKKT